MTKTNLEKLINQIEDLILGIELEVTSTQLKTMKRHPEFVNQNKSISTCNPY